MTTISPRSVLKDGRIYRVKAERNFLESHFQCVSSAAFPEPFYMKASHPAHSFLS